MIVSCGMDHSLKIWQLDKPIITEAMEMSRIYDIKKADVYVQTNSNRSSPTLYICIS